MALTPSVTVSALLAQAGAPLALTIVAGHSGVDRQVTSAATQKVGLALAGLHDYLRPGRLLVLAQSEIAFLVSLPDARRDEAVRNVLRPDLPAIIVTAGLTPPHELVANCNTRGVPLLVTPLGAPVALVRLMSLLEDRLAPRDIVHGVLMDVLGLGLLIVGESGIGKSECALDLVDRGHRLVADDAVEVRRRAESVLIGACPDLTRHHMEIRGIGVINVRDMYGVASTRRSKRIEFVVQLERWEPERDYERLGLEDERHEVLGVAVPSVTIPVAPGRNVALLVEVAARNQLLRSRGQHAARQLVERADRRLRLSTDPADGRPQTRGVEE